MKSQTVRAIYGFGQDLLFAGLWNASDLFMKVALQIMNIQYNEQRRRCQDARWLSRLDSQIQEEGRRVYYQDENWVFKNMSCRKVWKYTVGISNDGRFMVPSGKGERSILLYIGCAETELLDECMLLFRGSKNNKSVYYRSEMNWHVLSHWCETRVLSKQQPRGRDP